jgi:hypothetical protein
VVVLRIVRKKGKLAVLVLASLALFVGAAGAATEYDFDFHIYPNPYFPNADEYPIAYFSYILPANGSVSIYLYDLEGRLVSTVIENYPQVYGKHEGEVPWNGADDNGDYVNPGPYVAVLEVNLANEIYRDTFVVVVNR